MEHPGLSWEDRTAHQCTPMWPLCVQQLFPCPGWLSFIHRRSDTTECSDPQGRHCSSFYGLRVPVMSLALHFGDHIQGTGHVIQREATQLYHLMGRKVRSMRDVIGITFGEYYQPHNPKAFVTLAPDQACPHSPTPCPLSSPV